jgi:GntR family transcriptional regulator
MLLNISQHSELTLQDQIIGQMRARILSGELQPDQPLTSIRALAQRLRVGVNTVQRAYEHLLRERLIYARPGKGFFVAPLKQSDKSELAQDRFSEALRRLVEDAVREGLGPKELERVFAGILGQLHAGVNDADA